MNKIFKVVWSKAKQCYVVVSEVAKNHSGKKKIVVASVLAALAVGSEMTVVNVQATIPEGTVSGGAAVAVGPNSKATALHATAVGKEVEAGAAYSQAIGYQAKTTAQNGVAIGSSGVSTRWTIAGANDAVAIGTGAQSLSTNGVAIGRFSKVDESSHSVALGTGSEALAADSANTTSYLTNESVNNSGNGVISVGNKHKATDAGTITRRIVGVASGTEDFDAVNIKQLKALEKETRTRFLAVSGATNKTAADFADETWTLTPAVPASGTSTGTPATTLTLKGNFNNEAAVGERAVAVGPWANGIGARSVALGGRAVSNGMQAIALGQATFANGENTLALGSYASVHGENSLAIGTDTFVGKVSRGANEKGVSETGDKTTFAVAIGFNAKTYGNASVSLGKQAQADSLHSVVLGESSLSKEGDNTNTTAYLTNDAVNNAGNGVVSIGNADSNVTRRIINVAGGTNDTDAVNVKQLKALETKSVQKFLSINGAANRTKANYPDKTWTIGSPAVTGTDGSVTTPATTSNITLMGNYDNEGARGANSVALGQWANSIGPSSVALGSSAVANGNQAIALGQSTFGHGENTLALGSYATVNGENSIAIGTDSYVGQATRGGAGKGISATGNKTTAAIAIGFGAKAYGNASTVLGLAAQSDLAHSVVLGEGSKAVEDDGTNGTSYLTGDAVSNSGNGVVSIGNTTGGKNITRRIINVAGGTNDLDAVNVKQLKAVQANEWLLQTKNAGDTRATDVTAQAVTGETKKRVVLEAGDNIALENSDGTVKIKANVGVKSITSGNTTALTVSTVDANGAVTITPNIATNLSANGDSGKLVTAGTVNTALANKVDKTQLGNTPIKYRANGATEATAPTVALSKGFNFTAASDTVATTDVPKAGLAITTGTDGLVTFGLNKATRAAIDNAANKDLSNLSTTGENKVATLAKAAAAVAVKVTSDSTNVTVTKDTTTETGVTNYKVSVAKDVFDNGTNITKTGAGTTANPYKFNLNAALTGITSITNGTGAANAAGTTMTVGADGVTISNVKGADTKTVTIGNAGINAGSMKVTNVATPTDNGDAANKQYVDDNKTNIAIKTSATAAATDVTSDTVRKVTLEAGDNITLENNAGTVKIKANVGVKSITSGNTTALTVSTVDANGGVTITPNVATDLTDTNQAGKLVTAGTVNTALSKKANVSDLGNTTIKYRANNAAEASAPTVALSKGFNFTAASDTATDTEVPKAGLAITTGTDGLVTFGLNKATRAAIDNAANKDLSNLSDTGKTAVKDLAKAAATAAIKVTSNSDNVTVTKDDTTEQGITNYKVSVAKDAFDNGTNITKAGTGTTADPYKFNLNAALTGITSITNGTGAANAAGTTMTVGADGVTISNVKGADTKTVTIGNAGIDAGSMKITNVAKPTDNGDAANKKYVDDNKTNIAIKTSATAAATDVTSDTVRKVTLEAGDNITLENNAGTVKIKANVGVKSITSGDTTALTVSTVDANGGVTITPNVATDVTDTNQAGKLVTAGTVNTVLADKVDKTQLGNTPIKYRANGAEEASAPTVALSKGFNFTAASDTATDTDVPKAGLAITTGTDGLVTFGLNKATRAAIDNAANKDLSNLSTTGENKVATLAKAAAAAAVKVTSDSTNVTVTKDDTTETGITNYKVSVTKDAFDNGTNITKAGAGTTADPYKFNLNAALTGITSITNGTGAANAAGTTMTVGADGVTISNVKGADTKTVTIGNAGINAGSMKITNVATPTDNGDAANKKYVDDNKTNIAIKTSATAAATDVTSDTVRKVTLEAGDNVTLANNNGTITVSANVGVKTITSGDTTALTVSTVDANGGVTITPNVATDLTDTNQVGKLVTAGTVNTALADKVDKTQLGNTPIKYRANGATEATAPTVALSKGFNFTAASDTAADTDVPKAGLAITTGTDGLVTFGLNKATRAAIDNAANKDLSNLSDTGKTAVKDLAKAVATAAIKVTSDSTNVTVTKDDTTETGVTNYKVSVAKDAFDNGTNITKAGTGTTADPYKFNLNAKLAGITEIAGDGNTDLVIKNGDNKITITPSKAAEAGKEADPGTIDFGNAKVKVKSIDADIAYKAGTDTASKTVKLATGFNFTAASDTATDTDVPKAGLAITTGTDGLVTFGLNKATRAAIDNAANKDLSNLSDTGKTAVKDLAKAAATAAIKVTSDSTNVTVTKDDTTETGITNYKVSVAKDVFDNGTNITKAGAGTTADPYKFNLNAALTGITSITNGTGAANAAGTTMTVGADGVTISNVKGADTKTVTIGNAGIDAGSMKITNVAKPTDNGDAANKKYVDDNKMDIAIKANATAAATDVTSATVRKVTLEAGDNVTLANNNGTITVNANVGVKSITSGDTTALTVSTVDANGGVTVTPNVATDLTDTNQAGKLVTAGTVNTALADKVDKTQLGNTPIKYRANGATEATAPTVALSKGFNFTAASDTAADTDVPKAGLAITTGTDGLVTFGLNKATRAAIDNAANKDLSNLSTTGENKVATLAKAAAAAAVKVTSDSTNVTVTKDTTTETGVTNYKVSVAKDVFDNGTNITKAGTGTTTDPYKFNLNAKLAGITEIAGDGNTDLVIKNGDNKITITPSKAAEAGKEADPGTVDFGNAKVKVKNLDANISYKAGTDNAYKSVSLGTGFTFVAGTGTIAAPPAEGATAAPATGTDAETTKSGIAISVADNGVVNIGLHEDTRKAIDNAANKDLSNLSKTGETKVTELAKTAAQSAVKVVAGKNATVTTDDTTPGVTKYTVDANDTTIAAGSDVVTVSGGTLDETTKVRAYTVDLSDTAKTAIGKVAGLETRLNTVEGKVGVNEKAIAENKQGIADNKQGIADNKQGIADNKQAIANNTSAITQVTKDIQNLKGNSATKDLDNLSDTGKANITKLVSVVGENGIVVTEAPNKTTGGKTFTVKMGDTTKVGSVEIKDGNVSGLSNTIWNPTEVATAEVAQQDPTSVAAKNRGVAATQGQVKDLSDTISKGRVYETDTQGKKATVGLGDTLAIKGGATGELLDSNIGVELTEATATTPATMTVKLAKDVKMGKGSTSYDHYMDVDGKSTLVATTKVDGTGVTITPAKGIDKPVVQLTADGLNNGGNRITNVGAGKDAGDVATVGQVNDVISQTTAKIGRVLERTSQRIDQVGAHASALSAMNPLGFDPSHKSQIMAGIGSYGSNQALALGLAHYANENFMFNVGFTMGEGKSMANVGATYRFGTGDDTIPERYKGGPISSVYVMQDEISALKAENARKDAEYGNKIDMLMERIAMLEAKLK